MTQDETLRYWQNMRKAMEAAGDTSSAIYKRARSIAEGFVDPLSTLPPQATAEMLLHQRDNEIARA